MNLLTQELTELANYIEKQLTSNQRFAFNMGEWVELLEEGDDSYLHRHLPDFCGTAACIAGSYDIMKFGVDEASGLFGHGFMDMVYEKFEERYGEDASDGYDDLAVAELLDAITSPDVDCALSSLKPETGIAVLRKIAAWSDKELTSDNVQLAWREANEFFGTRNESYSALDHHFQPKQRDTGETIYD